MFFPKLLWFLSSVVFLGVTVSGFKLTERTKEMTVNVGENVTLDWTFNVTTNDQYVVLWGTGDGKLIVDPLFTKSDVQATPQASPRMPPSYAGRVKIIRQASLFIKGVDLSDERYYCCELRGDFVTIRRSIKLTVTVPPQIITQLPSKITWKEGEDKRLICEATGKPKAQVSWQRNGSYVVKGKRKAEIAFPIVSYKNAGTYKCVAKNTGGHKEKTTKITVLYAPKDTSLTTDAPENEVSDGSSFTLICKAHGNPPPKYKFYINGDYFNSRSAERTGKLEQSTVSISSESSVVYSCAPENSVGPGPRKEVTVYIRRSPEITLPPQDLNVNENDPVNAECKARGYPPPKITWIKLLGNKVVGKKNSFFIGSARRSDQGRYRCIASNGYGDDDSADFEINVYYAPVINRTASSQNVPAFPGYETTLNCVADGNPEPKYIWSNSSGVISRSESGGKLKVKPQDKNSFGPYTCTVRNSKGSDQLDITLVQVGEPEVTLSTRVITLSSIEFHWELSSGGRNPVQHYILQYRTKDMSDTDFIDKIQISPENMSYKLTNLLPFTVYVAELYATNDYFTGPVSRVIKRTLEGAPGAPRDIVAYAINGTTIHVQWLPPVRPNGVIIRYTVLFNKSKHFITSPPLKLSVMPNVTQAYFSGLEPFTNYTVQVQVWNSVDRTNSIAARVRTKPSAPSKPEKLEVNTTGPHSAWLRWKKPRKANGRIGIFQVLMRWRYHNAKDREENISINIPAKLTGKKRRGRRRFAREAAKFVVWNLEPFREVELKRVQPFAVISLRVREATIDASGAVLWSVFSGNQTIMTLEGAPSEPRNVEIQETTTSSIKVTWQAPRYPNGIIQKYRILYSNSTGKNYTVDITTGLNNASLFYTITGLMRYATYKVYVQAFTNYSGMASSPVIGSTGSQGGTLARSGVDTGSLYGGVFAGIILLAFAIIIVALVVRNRRKRRDSTELKSNRYAVANSNDSGIGDKESLDRVPGIKYLQGSRRGSEGRSVGGKQKRNVKSGNRCELNSDVVGPGKFVTVKPIPVQKLRGYCEINHADSNKAFREEFLSIRVPGNFTWEHSQKPENKAKNRYQNIIPYDHTRVTLNEVEGFQGTDYINANFIDGYNHHYKFIATQGPVANTFGDFWRTVWDQGVCVIVMVTNIVERGRIKCLKYWPSGSPDMHGPILVTPVDEEEVADYVIRKFSIQMTSNTTEFRPREVTQFHFTAWPDHGVPAHATSLLAFLRKVRAFVPEDSGPILVHCSAGVGRTGTFIVLDAMLDQINAEGVVDIYGFVSHIRQQRSSMVQTEAQYIFVHDALVEFVTCGNTEFNVRELPEKLRILNSIDPDSGDTLMVGEFKNLGIGDGDTDSFVSASLPENKAKNRFAILPYDRTRVKLWPYTGVIGSDFVNANFVDSFQQREAFIATQAPLENTVVDFWRMAWEYESYSIVMLTTPAENEEGQCAQYVPRREEFIVYGLLMIEVESEEDKNGFCRRHLKLTNTKSGEVRNLYHFHFTEWTERSVPLNGTGLLDMMRSITRVQQQTCNGPIIVHCSDGSGRTGAFCAINIALERVKLDGTVDMFQNVRRLRTQRPLMVQTAEQYKFCYDMVRLFVDSYGDYANFK